MRILGYLLITAGFLLGSYYSVVDVEAVRWSMVIPALAVGLPREDFSLLEGGLERSNVRPVRELASLIILQRAFDVSMQILGSDDAATERLLREVSQ